MRHQQPDRVPIDFGATSLTGLMPAVQSRLIEALGLEGAVPGAGTRVCEGLLEWAGCDFRSVGGIVPLRGELSRQISDTEYVDCWGVRRKLIGEYWDVVESPLQGASLEDLASFPWPDTAMADALLERLRSEARRLAEETPYVVIGEHPVLGVLELCCWVCGYEDTLLRMHMEPEFIHALMDRYLEMQIAISEKYYEAIGEYVTLTMSGDDFGTQSGPLLSPELFRELIAPRFSERIARTKALGPRYYWHHSCGAILDIMDDIVACGVDILNPVQTSARGMELHALKAAAGERLTLWGAIDTQRLLCRASPDEVAACVRETKQILGENGGYVLAPAHNIQSDAPVENIIAMVEAAKG